MTSWGTLPDKLRDAIQQRVKGYYEIFIPSYHTFFFKGTVTIWSLEQMFRSKMFSALYDDEREALDEYHTHFLLFDIGDPCKYLNDTPRSNFVKAACSRTGDSRSLQV